ncbi:hypothetical protein A2U01_0055440, partial [Trifolium medium]|nr:hypothetical protein [Trifolium medium]
MPPDTKIGRAANAIPITIIELLTFKMRTNEEQQAHAINTTD